MFICWFLDQLTSDFISQFAFWRKLLGSFNFINDLLSFVGTVRFDSWPALLDVWEFWLRKIISILVWPDRQTRCQTKNGLDFCETNSSDQDRCICPILILDACDCHDYDNVFVVKVDDFHIQKLG